jgi:hypothetical protein
MANLNIPFILIQPSLFNFTPCLKTSKLISYEDFQITIDRNTDRKAALLQSKGTSVGAPHSSQSSSNLKNHEFLLNK